MSAARRRGVGVAGDVVTDRSQRTGRVEVVGTQHEARLEAELSRERLLDRVGLGAEAAVDRVEARAGHAEDHDAALDADRLRVLHDRLQRRLQRLQHGRPRLDDIVGIELDGGGVFFLRVGVVGRRGGNGLGLVRARHVRREHRRVAVGRLGRGR